MKKNNTKKIKINIPNSAYTITLGSNLLKDVDKYFDVNRKILIVTDDNIPKKYIKTVKDRIKESYILIIRQRKKSKNFTNYQKILQKLIKHSFTRHDAVIAIGGGVIGDMAAFAASTYMRGIDFYNIPTTLLSQVDSSIGGKTAIDYMDVKNIIGTFYQPKAVLIDTDTLKSLPERQLSNGMVESIKMAATFDKKFFNYLKTTPDILENANNIVYNSLKIKKAVVEKDEKEKCLRKVLNFGHTIGHAIEESLNLKYLHGECVGVGMLYFSSEKVKIEIENILANYKLPTKLKFDKNKVLKLVAHDKKSNNDTISIIYVNKIGTYKIEKLTIQQINGILNK